MSNPRASALSCCVRLLPRLPEGIYFPCQVKYRRPSSMIFFQNKHTFYLNLLSSLWSKALNYWLLLPGVLCRAALWNRKGELYTLWPGTGQEFNQQPYMHHVPYLPVKHKVQIPIFALIFLHSLVCVCVCVTLVCFNLVVSTVKIQWLEKHANSLW